MMQKKTSEELLWQSLEQVPGYVYWKDTHGCYLGCNEEFARAIGVKKEAIIGRKDAEISHLAPEAAHYAKADQEVWSSGRPKWGSHEVLYNQAGKPVKVVTNRKPLLNAQGSIIGIIGLSLPEDWK
jgi:PAS domain S-box-containing protein